MKKTLLILGLLLSVACDSVSPLPTLRIASDATFAPFHWVDESGRPTGFDIELARAVAANAGFEPEVIVLPYEALFSGLGENTHDVVAATTGVTPERESLYLLSQPYYETCQVAVVRAGPDEPTSVGKLKGLRVGAAGSGTSMKAMQSIVGEHIRLEDGQGVESLEAGKIDAWLVDEFDGVTVARESQGRLLVLPEPVALERYAFVLARDREELKSRLNRSLAELEKNGTVKRLRARFGVDRDASWPVEWRGDILDPNVDE